MYRLIIIDDEPVVRAGIKDLLSWEDYNFEVCAEGIDGRDGLRKILKYLPDLVLIDIKMPGLSGIEVIREARMAGFEGKFIILTGHSDFEFAKSAISLGVRAYLLKPIDENELIENLKELAKELESKKHLDNYYTLSELKARKEVLHRLLFYSDDKEKLRKEIKLYGMDFKYHIFCTAILNIKGNVIESELSEYNNKLDMILRDLDNVELVSVDERAVLICKGMAYQESLDVLKENNRRIKIRYGDGFFISMGHNVSNLEDIHFSYESAKYLLDYEFSYVNDEFICIDIFDKTKASEDEGLYSLAKALGDFIEIGDADGIEKIIKTYENSYKSILMKESDIKILISYNMLMLHNTLIKKYDQQSSKFPDLDEVTKDIKNADNLDDLLLLVYDYCILLNTILGISTAENVAKRMKAYMEKNYHKDLKLESIAKIFNYNSAYLGKLFKKEIGESFNNILDTIRIDNAKRLLLDTELKVYQVSEKVGYSNIDYFYSKFKKNVGLSPREYKKHQQD